MKATNVAPGVWVIKNNSVQTGSITATQKGYRVRLGSTIRMFDSFNAICSELGVEDDSVHTGCAQVSSVMGYPTHHSEVFNPMIDVNLRLPLYTVDNRSQCYFAAGYYAVENNNQWMPVFCPRYVVLTRKKYLGPYHTAEQRDQAINDAKNP